MRSVTVFSSTIRDWLMLGIGGRLPPGGPDASPRSRAVGFVAKAGRRQDANVQVAMGRDAELGGDLDTAMAAYHEALKNDPHRADANQRLAVVHDRLGQFQESAAYYSKALAAAPGDAEIFLRQGLQPLPSAPLGRGRRVPSAGDRAQAAARPSPQ